MGLAQDGTGRDHDVAPHHRIARVADWNHLNPKQGYVAAMTDWKDPLYQKIIPHLPAGSGPEDYITSLEITARKAPANCCSTTCCS